MNYPVSYFVLTHSFSLSVNNAAPVTSLCPKMRVKTLTPNLQIATASKGLGQQNPSRGGARNFREIALISFSFVLQRAFNPTKSFTSKPLSTYFVRLGRGPGMRLSLNPRYSWHLWEQFTYLLGCLVYYSFPIFVLPPRHLSLLGESLSWPLWRGSFASWRLAWLVLGKQDFPQRELARSGAVVLLLRPLPTLAVRQRLMGSPLPLLGQTPSRRSNSLLWQLPLGEGLVYAEEGVAYSLSWIVWAAVSKGRPRMYVTQRSSPPRRSLSFWQLVHKINDAYRMRRLYVEVCVPDSARIYCFLSMLRHWQVLAAYRFVRASRQGWRLCRLSLVYSQGQPASRLYLVKWHKLHRQHLTAAQLRRVLSFTGGQTILVATSKGWLDAETCAAGGLGGVVVGLLL